MKAKSLSLAALVLCSALSIGAAALQSSPVAAFSASDCGKGTLYYNYHYTGEVDSKGKPKTRSAKEQENLRKPKSDIKTAADCNLPAEDHDLMDKSNQIINVIVSVVGVVSVAVIVIGGITFATSQGDTAKTTKGKNTVLFGLVGLVIALLAFAIVNFVLKSVF